MKSVSSGLATHLTQEVTTLARCWKIVRQDGQSFFFTTHDVDLIVDGDTYKALAGFSATAVANASDLSVDNMEVMGVFDDDSITLEDLRAGAFDFATVYIFIVNWSDLTQGILRQRRGTLGEVTSSPQGWFTGELRGMSQLLQQQIVELYGPTCRADLFDSRCALSKDNYVSLGHCSAVADKTHITVVIDTPSVTYVNNDDWFKFGVLKWVTGANAGRAIEIKSWNHSTGAIEFYTFNGYVVAPGDTFQAIPGCDKSLTACRDKFHNILNMRAEPYLPGNDQVFNYPDINPGA